MCREKDSVSFPSDFSRIQQRGIDFFQVDNEEEQQQQQQ
jgi:hypothetical protein